MVKKITFTIQVRILTVVQNENQIDQDIEKQMFISS